MAIIAPDANNTSTKQLGGPTPAFVLVNPTRTYTQITISGRNVGNITVMARPYLISNAPKNVAEASLLADVEFETVTGGTIALSSSPGHRTVTIENKKLSVIKLIDDQTPQAPGTAYTVEVHQWSE